MADQESKNSTFPPPPAPPPQPPGASSGHSSSLSTGTDLTIPTDPQSERGATSSLHHNSTHVPRGSLQSQDPVPSAAASSAMPSRVQIDTHARRRSRGQSISTSFSPAGTFSPSAAGTPTDILSPSARARSLSQSIQNLHNSAASPRTPVGKDENSSDDSFELNTLSSGDSDEETGLTEAARERRRQKKNRRKGLGGLGSEGGRMRDNAASPSHGHVHASEEEISHGTVINGIAVTSAEKAAADQTVLKDLAINAGLIGLWYMFSLLISVYNKWMFSGAHLDFKFPLFVTSLHMIVQFSLASLVIWYFVHLRPGYAVAKNAQKHRRALSSSEGSPTRNEESEPLNRGIDRDDADDEDDEDHRNLLNETQSPGPKRPIMTKLFYATRIAPCGMATGLDIGLGNMSLKYISLAFYTMCKSSSLAFVLIFAFIFRLEKPTIKLVAVITVMTIGVVMMVFGEAVFVLIGFVLVMLASMLSGLRWSLTQLLLLRNPATSNPFSSIFFLAPVMFFSLFIIAIPVEGIGKFWTRWSELAGEWGVFTAIGMLIAPGVVAFCMTASEFALLRRTSVVTLSICGIFKEVVTISASATIFEDRLTPINITGLLITILSIAGYNYIKIKQMRGEAVRDVLASEGEDVEGRRSLVFERASLALNRSSVEAERRSGEIAR